MLKMAQKEYIKHLYEVEEKSVLEIANTTGFNYRTVRKYAYQEDWSNDALPNIEQAVGAEKGGAAPEVFHPPVPEQAKK